MPRVYMGPRPKARPKTKAAAETAGTKRQGILVMTDRGPVQLPPWNEMDAGQLRAWRRKGHGVQYDSRFILSSELRDLTEPLGRAVAALADDGLDPGRFRKGVADYVERVHSSLHPIAGWTASAVAEARTAHLDGEARGRSKLMVADLARRPTLPDITEDDLREAWWPGKLVALAAPYDGALSDLLRQRFRQVSSGQTVSDALVKVLREIDRAGKNLLIRLDGHRQYIRHEAAEATKRPKTSEQMRNELRELGIEL